MKCPECGEVLSSKRKILYGTRFNPLVCTKCKRDYRLIQTGQRWKRLLDFLLVLTFPVVAIWLVGIWNSFIPVGVYVLILLVAEIVYEVKAPFVVVRK